MIINRPNAFTLIEIIMASMIASLILVGMIGANISLLSTKNSVVNKTRLSQEAQMIVKNMLNDASVAVGTQKDPAVVNYFSGNGAPFNVCFNKTNQYTQEGDHFFICYGANGVLHDFQRWFGGSFPRPNFTQSAVFGKPAIVYFGYHLLSYSVRATTDGWNSVRYTKYDAINGSNPDIWNTNRMPGSAGAVTISDGWQDPANGFPNPDLKHNQTGVFDVIVETCLDPTNPPGNVCVVSQLDGQPILNADGTHTSANNPNNPYAISRGSVSISGQSLN